MPAPAAPANLRALNIGIEPSVGPGAMIRLGWDDVAGAAFRAQIMPKETGGVPTEDFTLSVSERVMLPGQLDCVFSRMLPDERYKFRVRAENSSGVSAWVELQIDFPQQASTVSELAAASGLAAVEVRSTSVFLQWTDNADDEHRFRIIAREAGGSSVSADCEVLRNSGKISGLRPATTYFIQVFPIGSFFSPSYLVGPGSNEIAVTTSNPPIELRTQLGTYYAWRTVNHTPLATVLSNVPVDDLSAVGLPAGLVATNNGTTTNTISGTPTAAVGAYTVTFTGDDGVGNDDTITLKIIVDEPSITLAATNPQIGYVANPLAFLIPAIRRGPIAAPIAWTFSGLPSWAAGNALTGEITGTPDASGESLVTVTATNGTQIGEIDFLLSIFPASIAPFEASVYAGRPFSIELTPSNTAVELTLLDAPAGVTIAAKELIGDLQSLIGTAEELGVHRLALTARLGTETFAFEFKLTVLAQIVGPDIVEGWLGDPLFEALSYVAAGPTVEQWALSNQPVGVSITQSGEGSGDTSDAHIGGAPTSAGIFEALVTTFLRESGVFFVARKRVTFRISGGLFLAWFHDSPSRSDLQVFLRSKEVRSYADPNRNGWRITRGDKMLVFVLFRDGPLEGNNLGRRVLSADDFPSVTVTIRPPGDYDCDPLLEFTTTTTQTIDGNKVHVHELTVESPALEEAFETLNLAPGGEVASEGLLGSGQIRWTQADGRELTSRLFPVVIEQDENR